MKMFNSPKKLAITGIILFVFGIILNFTFAFDDFGKRMASSYYQPSFTNQIFYYVIGGILYLGLTLLLIAIIWKIVIKFKN